MRTFIAVTIPATPLLRKVHKTLSTYGSAVRPVEPDNLHVTLKFLGDTDNDDVAQISRIVKQVAKETAPFTLKIIGLGAFPKPDRPTVVWAGLHDAEPLIELVERLEEAIGPLGFPREHRAFHPHVTLARVKRQPPPELFKLLESSETLDFGTADIRVVEYMQSQLSRERARYAVLASGRLKT